MIDPKIAEYRGRIVKTTGDGLLVEFASVVDALRCAVEIQRGMADRKAGVPPDDRIEFRIGINQGDIVVEDGDISATASMSPRASKPWPSLAGFASRRGCRRMPPASSTSPSRTSANRSSKTSPGRCASIGCGSRNRRQPTPADRPHLPLPDKPSIAVLPFQNMSGDPEQEYFVDGMVEEIITALSRIRWLFVIARNSSFTYKGQAVDVKQVGRELGVRYVLEGSVRKAGNRVRITAQLIDAATGAHLWADRFDGSLEDVFELQDKVASASPA